MGSWLVNDQLLGLKKEQPSKGTDSQASAAASGGGGIRRKSQAIKQYLGRAATGNLGGAAGATSTSSSSSSTQPARPVTAAEMRLSLVVVRGPHWRWEEDDGGAGSLGVVLMFDPKVKLATVFWHDSGVVRACYRYGKYQDLGMATSKARHTQSPCRPEHSSKAPVKMVRSWVPSRFSAMRDEAAEEDGDPSKSWSLIRAVGRIVSLKSRRTGEESQASEDVGYPEGGMSVEESNCEPIASRNSQAQYADKSQTAIIFDWDDTLFPTSYAFNGKGGPRLLLAPMQKQDHLSNPDKTQVGRNLMRCAMRVDQLLKLAASLGKVVIVTLAETGWVESVCRFFFPGIHRLLQELDVTIVYAKSLMSPEDAQNEPKDASTYAGKLFWSQVKGKAVQQELERFYSQYEGQSWKNVVSIGDADFERLGTRLVTAEYQKALGVLDSEGGEEVSGHVYKVRTKTFKMIENPMIDELEVQHNLLLKWLPLIVKLDGNFDASLNDVDDSEEIRVIGEDLEKQQPHERPRRPEESITLVGEALSPEPPPSQAELPEPPGDGPPGDG